MGVVVTMGYSKYTQRGISTSQELIRKYPDSPNRRVGLSELLGSKDKAKSRKLGLYQHNA